MNGTAELERRQLQDRRAKVREGLHQLRRQEDLRRRIRNVKVNDYCARFYAAAQRKDV